MPRRRRRNNLPKPCSCQCEKCLSQCSFPGWFAYGEAEKVAEYLGTSIDQLFLTRLCAIRYVPSLHMGPNRTDEVWGLVPATTDVNTGTEMPLSHSHGNCVFFDEVKKLCSIHDVKPFVCRRSWHWDINEIPNPSLTYRAVLSWATPFGQKQIADLLVAGMLRSNPIYVPRSVFLGKGKGKG